MLIVLDLVNCKMFILDPANGCFNNKEEVYSKIIRFISTKDRYNMENKLNYRKWSLAPNASYPHQKINDNYNCGVYVLYYMYKIKAWITFLYHWI